ncbi:enoyl-CoA hydratase/isomerase family protein [Actinocorallia sp. A-T 12471]|uniref:enoyl-CoA hydratase/isomerase family protein n=1 Tax=Actinocorallia sp. A-T 12471 TaxID=3089813 RepID=UPI0029CFBE8B|nr:enoyl-CoA hydratase/isomerase family protein [Actinocorallia sp. A-T 12471]MDX6740989.1 enoyl-CoA hydratase/isomerase family protein [Actinocorallia sp. A-T 12471]
MPTELPTYKTLKYEEFDRVAVVTLNRPEVHNAFDSLMMREIAACWRFLRDHDPIRCIVLTGAGDKAFCTGLDRKAEAVGENGAVPLHHNDPGHYLPPKTAGNLYKPMIAAVNGMACAGAFYLLGEVEFIIAADHATFFDPHTTYGMAAVFEPMMMLQRMPLGEIMRLSLIGAHERLTSTRAHQIGLAQQLIPLPDLLPTTLSIAQKIASHPPEALETTVRSIWTAQTQTYRNALEVGQSLIHLGTTDASLKQGAHSFTSTPRPPWTPR